MKESDNLTDVVTQLYKQFLTAKPENDGCDRYLLE